MKNELFGKSEQLDDMISRAAVLALPRSITRNMSGEVVEETIDVAAIKALPPAPPTNRINLCDSCDYLYPDCPSKNCDVIFGNSVGDDNICACNKYKPSAQQWIPCKTAFPEKENTRVTYQTNAGVIIIDGIYGGIDACGHRVWLDRERGLYWDDEVVAWMPVVIPEPWKGEQDG